MATRRVLRSSQIHWLAALMTATLACGGDDKVPLSAPRPDGGGDSPFKDNPVEDAGQDSGTKPITLHPQPDGGMMYDDTEDDGGASSPASCGDVNCGLHGDCVMDMEGKPGCVCDHGYIVNSGRPTAAGLCIEDKSCVTARVLQCRYSDGGSAVGVHFSLQYCSGNPYTSLNVKDLIIEEKGNEDFQELLASESFATIVPRDFLTHVYLVVDVSNSIQQSNVLDDIATGIKTLLAELKKAGGNFRVSVFLFDGQPTLYEFIADTSDLNAASKKLDALNDAHGDDPSSSNVYGAVLEGIRKLDRARQLRSLVNDLGVLMSGTLIVVTDGDDRASQRTFADVQKGVADTDESVITVGLGDVANYPKLTLIGRDGSFSAPKPSLIDAAFQQIAGRIKDYRRSQYLVAYCSPKRKDSFITRVGVKDLTFDRPSCTFSAARFVGGCNADWFDPDKACTGQQCGGIVGCGECDAGSCCYGGQCVAPGTAPEDTACGQEWMCSTGTTCSADKCSTTVALSEGCDATHLCDLQVNYCASAEPANPGDQPPPPVCMAAQDNGAPCKDQKACKSQHCGLPLDQPFATSKICLGPTEMYQGCADTGACEPGSYCDGMVCRPMRTALCESNAQCESGNCETLASGTKMCGGAPACYFPLEL